MSKKGSGVMEQVPLEEVKKLIGEGYSKNRIASKYNLHRSTVDDYLRRRGTSYMDIQIEIINEENMEKVNK